MTKYHKLVKKSHQNINLNEKRHKNVNLGDKK